MSILEIVQVEKYVSRCKTINWRGRKPLDRQSMARAFVAKTLYRLPTTSDLDTSTSGNQEFEAYLVTL